MIYGEDDGSSERDDIECQMQEVMRSLFDAVLHFGPLGDHGTTEDRIKRAREFLRRETVVPLDARDAHAAGPEPAR